MSVYETLAGPLANAAQAAKRMGWDDDYRHAISQLGF